MEGLVGGDEVAAIIIIFTYGAVVHYLMNQSLTRTMDPEAKVLIILGASVKDNQVTSTLYSRLEKGAKLLQENPQLLAIVTGGKGSFSSESEAQIMKDILVKEFNIEEQRIQVEDKSRNTYENLINTKPLLLDQKSIIITSEFHTLRTAFLAKRVGMKTQLIGAETPKNKRLIMELREHIAIIKSWFFDSSCRKY